MSGDTASVAYAVDRRSGKRYVMDVDVMTSPSPTAIRTLIRSKAERYRPQTIVVESNAFQLFLTQDEEIRSFLASKGISLTGPITQAQTSKTLSSVWPPLPVWFKDDARRSTNHEARWRQSHRVACHYKNENVRKLVEQLITWQAGFPEETEARRCDGFMVRRTCCS